MKISYDISNLNPDYKGGSNSYSEGLLKGLINHNDINKIIVIVNKYYFKKKKLKNKINLNYVIYEKSLLEKYLSKIFNRIFPYISIFLGNTKYYVDYKIRNFLNKNFKKLVENSSDILITPNVNLTVYNLKVPTVVNLHDIQQKHFPKFFPLKERLIRDYTYYNTAKYASKIVTSLNFIKQDLLKNYNFLKSKKIETIYAGVDMEKYKQDKITLKTQDYFFFPAQFWPHKNHKLVLKAYDLYLNKSKKNFKLVMSGESFEGLSNEVLKIIKNSNVKYVKYLGAINHKNLLINYKSAIATICPAVYEASALPMLESFALKTSVIISDIPSHNEESKRFDVKKFKFDSPIQLSKIFLEYDNLNKKKLLNINEKNFKKVKNYNWDAQSLKWINLCKNLI